MITTTKLLAMLASIGGIALVVYLARRAAFRQIDERRRRDASG